MPTGRARQATALSTGCPERKHRKGNKAAGRQEPLPTTASMIHAKSCMSTFGLEDISSQHTMVMAQRSEITPALGQTDMMEEKQVWTIQIKIMSIAEHLLQATMEIQLFLNLVRSMFLSKNKIAIQQNITG